MKVYEPCQTCLIRFEKSYTKECDNSCNYAKAIKDLKEARETLNNAYLLIGQLIEKPNCFTED